MGFCLGHLIRVVLLFVNALAIINEKRVLNKLGAKGGQSAFDGPRKGGIVGLITSTQTVMECLFVFYEFYFVCSVILDPLIFINIVWIFLSIAF
jgi:hypothetical protein